MTERRRKRSAEAGSDREVVRTQAGGLTWRVVRTGNPDGFPLVLLHGFTGRAEGLFEIAGLLAQRACFIPDLPGHGETERPDPPQSWRMPRLANALAALFDRLGIDQADLTGYSMGARAALHLALGATDRVRRLALIGATPGIESASGRAARAESDMALADLLDEEGIEAFVDYWETQPIFATQRALPASARARIRETRLAQDPASLAAALRAFSTGFQEPVHAALHGLPCPTLLVAGEMDEKFRAIAESMRRLLPSAGIAIVPGAGHAVPSERPDALAALLESFFSPAGA